MTYLNIKLMPHFYNYECTRDKIIFKEGDLADKVFIIKDGEFAVSKKLIHKEKE